MRLIAAATNMYRRHWILVSSITAIILLRAILLLITPPGFYLDEAASGAHAISLLTHGTNGNGEAWPLFSASLGGGYTTPIYLYPLAAWAHLFGSSEYALRAFSLVATIGTAGLLALTIRRWQGTSAALVAALVALVLPWGWVQGSLAWDPALVPLLVAASLYSFSVALQISAETRRRFAIVATGICLIALAYLYPPCRVTAPLLLALYYGILLQRKLLSIPLSLILAASFGVLCIPLLQFMLQPEAMQRSSQLSVFYETGLLTGTWQMILNFVQMLSPLFLFVAGDGNLRHATGQQGMLGLAALPALGALLYAAIQQLRRRGHTRRLAATPTTLLILVALLGIALSLLGSALTAEGQPHSLRATAAWPFFVVLITLGWTMLLRVSSRALRIAAITFAVMTTVYYVYDLAANYPQRSAEAFDVPVRQAIDRGKPPANYPSLSLDYYDQTSN